MEASGALAGSDAAQDPAGGAAAPAAGGLDLSPVLSQFEALGGRMERLEGLLAPGEEEGAGDDEAADEFDFASLFAEQEQETEAGQGQLNPQALQAMIDQRAQQLLDGAMGPLSQQVRAIQVGLDAEQLTAKYPDLAKPEVAGPVVKMAREMAEAAGNPDLATNTRLLELAYKAHRADQYAAGEVPVGDKQGFDLERAGGAGPAAGDESNIAERLIANRQKTDFWNKW